MLLKVERHFLCLAGTEPSAAAVELQTGTGPGGYRLLIQFRDILATSYLLVWEKKKKKKANYFVVKQADIC